MRPYGIDITNAFQTNIITDPSKRHYLSLPALYLKWFLQKWPNHPISSQPANTLVLQTLKCIQGTKYAVRQWYKLLDKFLRSTMHIIASTISKCIYIVKPIYLLLTIHPTHTEHPHITHNTRISVVAM